MRGTRPSKLSEAETGVGVGGSGLLEAADTTGNGLAKASEGETGVGVGGSHGADTGGKGLAKVLAGVAAGVTAPFPCNRGVGGTTLSDVSPEEAAASSSAARTLLIIMMHHGSLSQPKTIRDPCAFLDLFDGKLDNQNGTWGFTGLLFDSTIVCMIWGRHNASGQHLRSDNVLLFGSQAKCGHQMLINLPKLILRYHKTWINHDKTKIMGDSDRTTCGKLVWGNPILSPKPQILKLKL